MSTFKFLEECIELAVREILVESKQNLMNIGYPEVIASLLIQKFGKNAFTAAKWMKDSSAYRFKDKPPKNWWEKANSSWLDRNINIADAVRLYNAAASSEEEFNKIKKDLDLYIDPKDEFDPISILKMLREEIAEKLFDNIFFHYQLIEDILNKKLTNLKPYKDLSFQKAKDKYDERRIFDDGARVVKAYKNGWRWINAGAKCQLVGGLMKNCGSTGVMSMDPERTMIALFDPGNKPHAVVTYSPNEDRISGDEGQASTIVKSEYHDYILDLADMLNAKFDTEKTKSKALKIKSILRNKIEEIEQIDIKSIWEELYKIKLKNGKIYYSEGYYLIPEATMESFVKKFGSLQKAINEFSRESQYISADKSLGIIRL